MTDIRVLVNNISLNITGKIQDTKIIKVHNENLTTLGELSFPINFLAWRGLLENQDIKNAEPKNILQYYLQRLGEKYEDLSEKECNEKALSLLTSACLNESFLIKKACIIKERVCLFLEHANIIKKIINQVLKENKSFGQSPTKDEIISIRINQDFTSNLTTTRLEQLQKFAENILNIQGYKISREDSQFNVLLTSKSQGKIENDINQKIVCGVVKNSETDLKETLLDFDSYLEEKINEIEKLDEDRLLETESHNKPRLRNIAMAVVTFELLGFRPSRPVVVGGRNKENNEKLVMKAGAFVLYNVARIEAILRTFSKRQLAGEYPEIPNVKDVDFSLLKLEQEWSLIWNFVVGYKQTLMNSVQYDQKNLDLCPQHLTSFLSNWSRQFSIYYHRTRVLTDGKETLIPTMVARVYLLKALHIIVNNALSTLNLVSVSTM